MSEWSPIVILRSHVAVDGSLLEPCSVAMRRRVADEWQYRKADPKEESDFCKDDAW